MASFVESCSTQELETLKALITVRKCELSGALIPEHVENEVRGCDIDRLYTLLDAAEERHYVLQGRILTEKLYEYHKSPYNISILPGDNGIWLVKHYITLTIETVSISMVINMVHDPRCKDYFQVPGLREARYLLESNYDDISSAAFYQKLEPLLLNKIPDKLVAHQEFCAIMRTIGTVLDKYDNVAF
jgi:hypothetical protein